MQAFREFKAVWDPQQAHEPRQADRRRRPFDADLRLGPEYTPGHAQDATSHFRQRGRRRLHARRRALHRHGQVPRRAGGTMCPSYRATREERYSTRGRARLLSEMLRGEVITDGWASDEVQGGARLVPRLQGLPQRLPDAHRHGDLQGRVPVALLRDAPPAAAGVVDGAHRRMGAARRAVLGPGQRACANSASAKWIAGVSAERTLPRFAAQTFRSQFKPERRRRARRAVRRHLQQPLPPADRARGAEVLEAAGCAVELPREHVCCGRPYYDYGMLDQAKRALEQRARRARAAARAGVPVVVLEPGCLSVFRDELRQLLPDDARAKRSAAQVVSLGEFLMTKTFQAASLSGRVLHARSHCHQKALWGTAADLELLQERGLRSASRPTPAAAAWRARSATGRSTYEASKRIAGLALLPALDAGAATRWWWRTAFPAASRSSRSAGRPTLHLAEVLAPR